MALQQEGLCHSWRICAQLKKEFDDNPSIHIHYSSMYEFVITTMQIYVEAENSEPQHVVKDDNLFQNK